MHEDMSKRDKFLKAIEETPLWRRGRALNRIDRACVMDTYYEEFGAPTPQALPLERCLTRIDDGPGTRAQRRQLMRDAVDEYLPLPTV